MHKGADKGNLRRQDLLNYPNSESECPASSVDNKRNEIRQPSPGNHLDTSELEYDWIITLAKMWDDPHQDFDLKLNH